MDHPTAVNRTLAYLVRADGFDYAVEAARAGTARSYVYGGRPVSRHDAIAAAEREARDARRGLWGPPCNGATSAADTAPAAAAPPQSFYEPATPPPSSNSAYYPNCAAARAAGAAPILAGQPGYRSGLDGDNDGVACER
ncbi:excalibur calcium-binding domain-containing protein [Mycolicibacterium sp. XJ879]